MNVQLPALAVHMGPFEDQFATACQKVKSTKTVQRIWQKDHTLWSGNPAGISDRLGWLDCPQKMGATVDELKRLPSQLHQEGFKNAFLLGMGGSSLVTNVFKWSFGVKPDHIDVSVVDTTDPDTINALTQKIDFEKSLFIVATKSGSTVETLSLQKYFCKQVSEVLGPTVVGSHFMAITDPGSGLAELAAKKGFRHAFLNDPDIGGRYSALSFFGLVPAALMGIDIRKLLNRAAAMAQHTRTLTRETDSLSDAALLGAAMAQMSKQGRDKLTLIISKPLAAFGPWAEQLVAESTGKIGQGILPVLGQADEVDRHCDDRFFVFLRLKNDSGFNGAIEALKQKKQPYIQIDLNDIYDLGAEFFRWEIATAIAGAQLGINPFDQPNVEAAKVSARSLIAQYQQTGLLPEQTPAFEKEGIKVFGTEKDTQPAEAVTKAIADHLKTDFPKSPYVAIQAYLTENVETDNLLSRLRDIIGRRFQVAVTVGYGPRFLHSTGQLHKGDGGHGLFIQLTADVTSDLTIPTENQKDDTPVTFGILFRAQASGDFNAISEAGRKVIRLHLGADPLAGLEKLAQSLSTT